MDGNTLMRMEHGLRDLVAAAVRERVETLLDGAVYLAPASASPRSGSDELRIPVVVAGEYYDLAIATSVRQHVRPGWERPPRYAVGEAVAASHVLDPNAPERLEWVVAAVLGERDDPRPGYRLAPLARGQDGRMSYGVGDEITVGPDVLEGNARSMGQVTG